MEMCRQQHPFNLCLSKSFGISATTSVVCPGNLNLTNNTSLLVSALAIGSNGLGWGHWIQGSTPLYGRYMYVRP